MMHSRILILYCLLLSTTAYSQSDIAVGTWRTHNSYNSLITFTSNADELVAATQNALFKYNPQSQEFNIITRISGLTDTDITSVGYNITTEKLIISYRNGNIDIINNNQIVNFPELLRADIPNSKEINHIYMQNQYSYLSADFGVMLMDLEKMEVKETLFELGPQGQSIKIFAATIASDSLYLATEIGVMRGSLNDNLKDFHQWKFFNTTDGLPNTTTKIILTTPTGLITAIDNEGIFAYDGRSWQKKNLLTASIFIQGSQNGSTTFLTTEDSVYQYTTNVLTPILTPYSKQPKAALSFQDKIWIADGRNGLVSVDDDMSIFPNGPYSNNIVHVDANDNSIIATPPAYDSSFKPLRNDAGFFSFSDGEWENFNSTGSPHTSLIPEFYDVTAAAYVTNEDTWYFSSFGYGLLKINSEAVEIIDENTPGSTLINTDPSGRNVLISALDNVGSDLAMVNFDAGQPLHLLAVNNYNWQGFSVGFPTSRATQIINMGNGTYWMRIAPTSGSGIKIYDAINNRELYLTDNDNSGGLPDNKVYDMALDREGKMWVATEKGVVFYYNAAYIFDNGPIDPVFPIFDGQILFKGDKVSVLAIDGGNRVWMGTTSGLWLFAGDGQKVISHFTASDSPLPTNDLLDLAINQTSGEIFIATENGLVSYRGTSTATEPKTEVKIFPNPVITSQHDIVTFAGVPENADLIITDSSGRFVFKTQANGNTAVWQGVSSNQSLSSGVYFVFITNDDGSQKQVGKIAIIN